MENNKIKCLIIANDLGITTPGIVFETIIRELTNYASIGIFTLKKRSNIDLSIDFFKTATAVFENRKLSSMSMTIFGKSLFDVFWMIKQKRKITIEKIKQYDVVISFTSSYHYKSILLGYYLSKKLNKKWIIYSVDAIPAPIGWSKNDRIYWNTKKFINKYIEFCDAFFSSNEQMLDYQMNDLRSLKKMTGILYTPIRNGIFENYRLNNNNIVFLYTGGLYGPRKKNAILDGFKMFLKEYPSAKFIFVGRGLFNGFGEYQDLIDSKNVILCDFREDLSELYKQASVLVDINAYFSNDVFLSSKIVNYLPLMKPILSISGKNSPSSNIFQKDDTIVHCEHDAKDICNAMKCISSTIFTNWENRNSYIELFSSKNLVDKFYKKIQTLVEENESK